TFAGISEHLNRQRQPLGGQEKRGFLSYALGANPRTKEKESPHVEHDTLPATPRPRPPALFLRPVLRHPLPTPPGLGPVRRAAQPLPRRPDPPRRHRSLPRPAPSLRSLLQLFQPRRLVRPTLRPAPGYQRYPALEDPRSLVPSRGRHPAAQARPTRLRPGLVPGRGGLDTQACRHGFGQQLGRAGLGRPHPLVVGLLLVSAVGLPPEDAGPWATRLRRDGAAGFPGCDIILIGEGVYANKACLRDLREGVTFGGRMRWDAAVYDPTPAAKRKGRRGPKAKKGPRLPSPSAAAKKADGNRNG